MNLGLNLRFGHEIKVCMMSHETYISLTWNFSVSRNVFSIISYVICVVLQIVFMFVLNVVLHMRLMKILLAIKKQLKK